MSRPANAASADAIPGRLGQALAGWRYRGTGRRDVRLDLLRGYAVFAMICDHVSNISWFSPLTGGNRFIVSAAEGFVFLAGLVMGMVYSGRIRRDGWVSAAESVLRRALTLYAVTVALTLLFVALFQFTDLRLWLDRTYGLGLTEPVELIVDTLTLRYTYHGTDILWMYTILIAATPLLLLLLYSGQWGLVLAASWALWLAYQRFPTQAAGPWQATNVNYFPVSPWQLLFVHGVVMGYNRDAVGRFLGRVPTYAYLIGFGAGMAFLIAMHRAYDTGRLAAWPFLGRLAGEEYWEVFEKTSVPPGRIAAFIILAGFAYSLVTVCWAPLRRALGWFLLPLGENSLRAYSSHLVFIVVVYNIDVLAQLYDQSRTANTILQAVTLAMTFGLLVGWKRLEAGIDWRPSMPAWPVVLQAQRHPLIAGVSLLVLLVTAGGAFIAGPTRGTRQTDLASATAEAGVLRYLPTATDGAPLTVLLAVHGDGESGPEFATALVPIARSNGWALIAPTIAYGDREDVDEVASLVGETLPRFKELADSLGGIEDQPSLSPRILIYGGGRGAHTARLFGLFYPRSVAAVATVGEAPCSLPTTQVGDEWVPVPYGLADLEKYTGEPFDREALGEIAFWIGLAEGSSEGADGCAWGPLRGRPPAERAGAFAELLRGIGSEVEIVDARDRPADGTLEAAALSFLRTRQVAERTAGAPNQDSLADARP